MYIMLVYSVTDLLPSQCTELAAEVDKVLPKYGDFYTPNNLPNVRFVKVDKNYKDAIVRDLNGIKDMIHFVVTPAISEKPNGALYFGEWENINRMIE